MLDFEVLIVTKGVLFLHDAQMSRYVLILPQKNILWFLTLSFFIFKKIIWKHWFLGTPREADEIGKLKLAWTFPIFLVQKYQ